MSRPHISMQQTLSSPSQISRVSFQGAPARWGRADGAISWPPQSSAWMWLVLTQIPLSPNACLDLSQPVPGWPGSKGIFTRRSCVGPASWVENQRWWWGWCVSATFAAEKLEAKPLMLKIERDPVGAAFFALLWLISSLRLVTLRRGSWQSFSRRSLYK